MKRKLLLLSIFLVLPIAVSAQTLGSFRDVVGLALKIVNYLMQTIFAVFSLGIIFTVFKYIMALNKGDGATALQMRQRLIWAIVGMAVLFSLWGIISVLTTTLGWSGAGIPLLTAPR